MTELALQYGRYGSRKIARFLRNEGFAASPKRVERLWRREGLKVPKRQPKRRRLRVSDGSCIRRRAEGPNHVWSYDFVQDRTTDGRVYRIVDPRVGWREIAMKFGRCQGPYCGDQCDDE
jgi:putative transposase